MLLLVLRNVLLRLLRRCARYEDFSFPFKMSVLTIPLNPFTLNQHTRMNLLIITVHNCFLCNHNKVASNLRKK